MSKVNKNYWQYVKESTKGMLTAWGRINWYWDAVVEGFLSAIFVALLLLLPFFFWLSPLVALLTRASDRRDARQLAKQQEEFLRRRRSIWSFRMNDSVVERTRKEIQG
ncbi:hypothetical protein [Cupriavidus taiwanensis]|uniref:hypothetical protein n=1 Tax=Cupriavidus taiwanensis TaxID=164546 RepID=UPI000303D0EF|nr:hypothetical protein [Cupriavidus taiwanensis]